MQVSETYWICEVCLVKLERRLAVAQGWQCIPNHYTQKGLDKHFCPEHKQAVPLLTATKQALVDELELRLAQSGVKVPMEQQIEKENALAGTDKAVVLDIKQGEVTRTGALDMQVCVLKEWTDEQVETFANRANLCGTETGWRITRAGDPVLGGADERVPCKANPNKVHIMLHA